ncbi:MAG: DUF6680 family protein [Maritimibacter sp.]
MDAEFWITTAAIVIGPLAAVLITQFLSAKREEKQRQLFVFRSLMSSRRTPLSRERVQALNLVEVEFAGRKKVIERFKGLLEIYNDTARWKSEDVDVTKSVLTDVDDKTAKLLQEMGKSLGFKLDNLELLRGGYLPEAFNTLERQQDEIRRFLAGLSDGTKALPTAVTDLRHSEQLLKQARETQLLIEHAQKLESEPDKVKDNG